MQAALAELAQALEIARTARKKGDALSRAGRAEADVFAAYGVGIHALRSALGSAQGVSDALERGRAEPPAGLGDASVQLAEAHGVLGGLLQRVRELDESLASYAAGAQIESRCELPSTYNRMNAIKQTLIIKGDVTLEALRPDLETLAGVIDEALRRDQSLGDSGWAWADLGDCFTLLGRVQEAERAYATFIAKAEVKSPERALAVLKQIAAKLEARGDPGAQFLNDAITGLQKRLSAP